MGFTVIVAEKPSVGVTIAGVVGADRKHDGYLEGGGYQVTWCIGHLVGLSDASAYDEKYTKWSYEDLPILPNTWKHEAPCLRTGRMQEAGEAALDIFS